MKRLASLGAATALLALTSASYSDEYAGYYDPNNNGTPSSGLRDDFKRGSKITVPVDANLTYLCALMDGLGGGTAPFQFYRVSLYRDNNGVPGDLISEAPPGSIENGTFKFGTCSQVSLAPLPPGDYWAMLHSGGGAGVIRYYSDTPNNWYGNPDAFSDGASDPFGPGGGAGNGTVAVFATYEHFNPALHPGRRTIGANPSAGLRADFKRGSPVDVTAQGKVRNISVYLDGLGGNVGSQQLTVVLYADSNGSPGTFVGSASGSIDAGARPGWRSFTLASPQVFPGRYWIMLHTGDNTGVIRYYADGQGNWYGNADLYADGPSNPFGPVGTGNGRISAFLRLMQ
jgi:hypothetical protein